ncbi:MAG: protein translocase subunit SecD, partial [Planctomycetota bacterium]
TTYAKWADVINSLAEPETGITAEYKKAAAQLADLNLNMGHLMDVLAMPKNSPQRSASLEEFKARFPGRITKIDAVVNAYTEYSAIGGRLDDPEDLKRMLKGAGVLEFRILPTADDGKTRSGEIELLKENLQTKGPRQASTAKFLWSEIENPQEWGVQGSTVGVFGEKVYVLTSNQDGETMLQGGEKKWKLKRAYPTQDQQGRRSIGFTHDEIAAKLFYSLTRNNIDRPLCILLDGLAITAPKINSAIRGRGIITGMFTPEEVEDTVNKLNAGSFPARLSDVPTSENSTGPTIGADNRDKGIKAGLIGLALVAAFMLVYYIRSGVIADVALFMNILFILAMMVLLRATFTLPGIAGIILTIGMSVDANVLIFERIREECQRGASLRTAIANGYKLAFRTIFDANITTFFVAMILYMVASEEIKGFAIVLMLGIASSMFTALFVTRVFFNFLIDKGLMKELKMLTLIRRPQINWMGMRYIFFTISAVLIAGGLFVFFSRTDAENSKYDIEFTGGTSVQIELKEGFGYNREKIESMIRDKGAELGNSALAAAKVYSIGETNDQYEIVTTETNKTTAIVSFTGPGQTAESVTVAIEKTMETASGTLYNLSVTSEGGQKFAVSTSQVNKMLVKDVLEKTFADRARVSEPQVDEIVSRAVRETFVRMLAIREDLNADIVSTTTVSDSAVELAEFLGGIRIECQLENETSYAELQDRFKDIRFKPDMQDLAWYRYKILNTDLTEFREDATVKNFIYVSVHPDAGYRELSTEESKRFIDNETSKVM